MLRPESRSLMLENFRPPPGYQLNRAVGTTFTLDLMSLLTAPLAFTFFDWEDADGRPSTDPLALLQAVREHASRIHLFCQAGEIQLPPTNQPLLAYLEESVVPVRAPNANGIFHPKVWVLRYVGDPDMPVRYRLLCMSRNLTFSRSWDTALVLDGVLKNRHLAIARNHPIGDFLQALPGMAVRAAAPEIQATLDMMQEEVRRVNFELPENFHELSFWPIGHRGEGGWPFRQVENSRFLVMSPFLSTTFMRRLHKASRIEHLISRPEALAALPPAALKAVESCWAMSPGSDFDSHEGADEPVDPVAHGAEPTDELAGLHAKLFVMDAGWNAHVWSGSANATEAAFARNVEFLIELVGRRKHCGIAALLGDPDREEGLRPLLQQFDARGAAPVPVDEVGAQLQRLLQETKGALASAALFVTVVHEDDDLYSLLLDIEAMPTLGDVVEASIWPATLAQGAAMKLEAAERVIRFGGVSVAAITAFFAVQLRVKAGNRAEEQRFVLRLPLHGAPTDRRERILQSLLTNPEQVMRLLLLLLSVDGLRAGDFIDPQSGKKMGQGFAFGGVSGPTLLEAMLRALSRNSESLDQVDNLICDLRQSPEGRALLPEGLDEIWEPIRTVRQQIRSAAGPEPQEIGRESKP